MNRLCHVFVLCVLPAAAALGEVPSVGHLLPGAVSPGKSVDVVFHGANLAGASSLWASFPMTAALAPGIDQNGSQPASVTYRITVPSEVPLGVGAVRVITPQGVSNVRLVLLDDLTSQVKSGSNKSPQTAQVVTAPVAIDGACDAESSDYYKIAASAGQRIAVEVFARRLGSPLDPVIRLLNASGRELAFSDDEPISGADGRFNYVFETAGDYFIEIRDVRFQGGGGHRYRLRIGDFPLRSLPYPLAAQKGTAATIELASGAVPAQSVNVPADVPGGRFNLNAAGATGQSAAWVTLLASDTVEQLEQEPNDTPSESTPVKVPGAIDGRFLKPNDRDFFQFEAKANQRLTFTGQTRSLGSPTDLFMRIYKPDGGVLGEAEDSGTDEGALSVTFPADGVYRLRVEDVNHRGGADEAYRILVEPYRAGFTLAAAAEKLDVPERGVFVVKVTAARRDYNGPITLTVEGAGEGCTLRHNIIPEGKPETTLNCTLPAGLTAGQLAAIKVVGTAKIGDADFSAVATTLPALRTALAGLPFPPAPLEGSIALGVGPVFPKFFELTAPAPLVPLVSAGASAKLGVQLARSNGFDDKVDVSLEGLPVGVTAKAAAIEKGKAEGALELTSAAAIPPGKHPIRVVGSATFKNQPQQFVLDQVALEGPPIAISFAPSGPLAIGGRQKGMLNFVGQMQPIAPAATYQSGVVRGAEGPRAPAWPGFEADNKAAAFSGVDKAPGDDRLTARLPIAAAGDYSLELWVYNARDLTQPNSPAISGYLYSRAGTPGAGNAQPGDHLGIGGVESSPRDKLFFYNGQTMVSGRTTINPGAWHHVALVRAGDDVKVYLDGEVANPEIQTTAPKNYSANEICLGTRSDGFAPFQGRLDEAAFFDVALTGAQIQAHVAAAKSAAARDAVLKDAPLAYWRLDEVDGQLARSVAPAHKRLVKLAWKNLPAGLLAPDQVLLVDAQDKAEVELAAAASLAPGKLEQVVVAGTTPIGEADFTAESPPVVVELNKP